MKQTAVEWLVEQLVGNVTDYPDGIIEQAKEMEREQIEEAYKFGFSDAHLDRLSKPNKYYNETYGGEK